MLWNREFPLVQMNRSPVNESRLFAQCCQGERPGFGRKPDGHMIHTGGVTGSIPVAPTTDFNDLARN